MDQHRSEAGQDRKNRSLPGVTSNKKLERQVSFFLSNLTQNFRTANLQGNCEAFGVGCVMGKRRRDPQCVQICQSCGKMFDIACKRVHASTCELENECGCISAEAPGDADIESDPPTPSFDSVCTYLMLF